MRQIRKAKWRPGTARWWQEPLPTDARDPDIVRPMKSPARPAVPGSAGYGRIRGNEIYPQRGHGVEDRAAAPAPLRTSRASSDPAAAGRRAYQAHAGHGRLSPQSAVTQTSATHSRPGWQMEPGQQVGRCQAGSAGVIGGDLVVAENFVSRA